MKAELHLFPVNKLQSVAIIGGGIASLLVADQILRLQPDSTITLYCKDEQLAMGASGNKQGAVYPHLQGSHSPLASLNARCYAYALEYYKSLVAQGIDFAHQWCGVLMQAHTEELVKRYQKVCQAWPEYTRMIDARASSEFANLALPYPSLWFADGGWLAPFELCNNLSAYLKRKYNMNVKLNTEVQFMEKKTYGWQLKDGQGTLSGHYDAVVLCGGHLTTQFEQSKHLPIEPIRGQVSRLNPHTNLSSLNAVLCHKGYVTPSQGKYQCFGATFDRNTKDTQPSPMDDERNLAQIKKVYSQSNWSQTLSAAAIIGNKAGIRANSPDHLPIVGPIISDTWIANNVDKNNGKMRRLDKLPFSHGVGKVDYQPNEWQGLFVLSGLGARGLTTAPLMATYLAEQMTGLSPSLEERLRLACSSIRYQVRALKRNKKGL